MSESCNKVSATSSNLVGLVLRKVAGIKSKTVAEAINRDTSTVSRILSNQAGIHLGELEAFLHVLGLSVIESDGHIVQMSAAKAEALRILALDSLAGGVGEIIPGREQA